VRAAFIHVLGDLVQSVGVFVAALLIYFKPSWKIADPISTFLFSVLVLLTTITILKDILLVLMEGTPKGLDFKEILEDLQNIRAVRMVHNLHIWSLTMGTPALSVHLAVDDSRTTQSVLREAQSLVATKYEIHHSTIQVEKFQEQMEDCSMCEEPTD
jgi:zinc transporter 2